MEGGELASAVGPDGEAYVSIDLHAVVLDGDGTVASAHEQLSARPRSSGGSRSPAGPPASASLSDLLTWQREWTLEPGDYVLNVAVLDNVSGKLGAASVDVDVRAFDGTWAVSDPLIVATDGAGGSRPVVLERVRDGESISTYVEVYGGVRPVLSGQVFAAGPQAGAEQQSARLFPLPMRSAGAGVHGGSLPLPPGLPPRRYVVQLQITDPGAEESEILRIPLEMLPVQGR